MFGDLPLAIEVAVGVSALGASVVAFVTSRNRGRNPWLWAASAFLLAVPAIMVLQTPSDSSSRRSIRWWPRLLLAGVLVAVSVILDQAHFGSHRIAALEAHMMASWFSNHTLLAEGPLLHAAGAALKFSGIFSGPFVLGLVGAALGALMIHRAFISTLVLALAGAILGTVAWFGVITSSTAQWLQHQTEVLQLPGWPLVAAALPLVWAAIACAWISERSERAV
jgi:hypothetical protein